MVNMNLSMARDLEIMPLMHDKRKVWESDRIRMYIVAKGQVRVVVLGFSVSSGGHPSEL